MVRFRAVSAAREKSATTTLAVIALIGLSIIAFMWDAALLQMMTDKLHMNDFGKFYYATRAFLEGRDMYAPTVATDLKLDLVPDLQFLDLNPPHFHLLIVPLAVLQPAQALGI